jgi:hypothetical protein
MKTKLLLLLFTIVFTTTNLHATDFTVDGIAYTTTSSTAPYTVAIVQKSIGYTGAVTIPASVVNSGTTYSVTSIGDHAFYNCIGLTSITIPSSVTTIMYYAFCGCKGLTSITIPSSVNSIGSNAFMSCSGLKNITIPSSVMSIGSDAFMDLLLLIEVDATNTVYSALDGVLFNKDKTTLICCPAGKSGTYTIPSSVTSVVKSAFCGCSRLTTVTIPNSVTSIGDQAFIFCSGLTSVAIPSSVKSIANFVFEGCSSLTNVTIPSSVKSIGDWAFYSCTGLASITIPTSVTSIGKYAFYQCTGLTSVTIPNSITSIGDDALWGCIGLTSIYADSTTPVNLSSSSDVFFSINKTKCTLHVPTGSKNLYAAANQWKDFTNIVEHTVTGIATFSDSRLKIRVMGRTVEIGLPEVSVPVQVLDINGRQLYNSKPSGSTVFVTLPQAGIYLVRVGNKVTKLVAP